MKLLDLQPLYGHDKLSALEANKARFTAPKVRQQNKWEVRISAILEAIKNGSASTESE